MAPRSWPCAAGVTSGVRSVARRRTAGRDTVSVSRSWLSRGCWLCSRRKSRVTPTPVRRSPTRRRVAGRGRWSPSRLLLRGGQCVGDRRGRGRHRQPHACTQWQQAAQQKPVRAVAVQAGEDNQAGANQQQAEQTGADGTGVGRQTRRCDLGGGHHRQGHRDKAERRTNGLSPRTSCKYCRTKNTNPKKAKNCSVIDSVPAANARWRKSRGSSSGAGWRSSQATNAPSTASPGRSRQAWEDCAGAGDAGPCADGSLPLLARERAGDRGRRGRHDQRLRRHPALLAWRSATRDR